MDFTRVSDSQRFYPCSATEPKTVNWGARTPTLFNPTPWYSSRHMMVVAGVTSCVPWTIQLFVRVMLTESKKHLILHLSMWLYCTVQSHWEYKHNSCLVKDLSCSDYQPEWNFSLVFFESDSHNDFKAFPYCCLSFCFYTLKQRQRNPRLCLRLSCNLH